MSKDPLTQWRERRAQQTAEHAEAQRQQNAEHVKATARASYINNGGSEDSFTKAWPLIRERLLVDEAVNAVAKGNR